jgi:hypothetical protein
MKPAVFIGSSVEGLRVAEAAQKELFHESDTVLWSQGVFRSTNVPIESLMSALARFDFALFVLLPEDPTKIRDKDVLSVRDNVIFELGLFLGKLGRDRTFFIAPRSTDLKDLHLPSDLSGISPATYDPNAKPLQAAVGAALYELKERVRAFGGTDRRTNIVYSGGEKLKPFHFVHRNSYIYKGHERASPASAGAVKFLPEGTIELKRTNTAGRYEIELRQNGAKVPSVRRKHDPLQRILQLTCEARVDTGEHTVRFVFKDEEADKWEDERTLTVDSSDWMTVDQYFTVPPSVDLLFRIDDLSPSKAPSSLYIRKLHIEEISPD